MNVVGVGLGSGAAIAAAYAKTKAPAMTQSLEIPRAMEGRYLSGALSLKQIVDVAVPVIVFLTMTAVGLDLSPAEFRRVRERPLVVAAGWIGPLILLPPIAVGLVRFLDLPEKIAAGLLLIAACPVGGISNAYSYLARASTALSVTLTSISCLAAPVTMPLLRSEEH